MRSAIRTNRREASSSALLAIVAAQIGIIIPMVGRSSREPAEPQQATLPSQLGTCPEPGIRDMDPDDPWSGISNLTLVIMKGVATVTGTTTCPTAKIEVVQKIGAADGVTEVRDRITVLPD